MKAMSKISALASMYAMALATDTVYNPDNRGQSFVVKRELTPKQIKSRKRSKCAKKSRKQNRH